MRGRTTPGRRQRHVLGRQRVLRVSRGIAAPPGGERGPGFQDSTDERTMKIREGTRVLVTAGASGIGRRIAATFLAEGARVHVCDVSGDRAADLLQELPEVGFTQADVAVPAEVERVFGDLAVHLGGLDVLINNAGIAGPTAPVEQVSPEDWRRTLDVNITGQFLCARLAVPLLKQAGGGSIVNLSSVAGRLGYPMRTPYAASKWAVVGFTQSLAMELGPHGIRVNALLPGMVEGDRIRSVITAKAAATQKPYEELEAEHLSQVSLRRMVNADEIANMALFLCSEAGAAITGQAISVCGNVERLV